MSTTCGVNEGIKISESMTFIVLEVGFLRNFSKKYFCSRIYNAFMLLFFGDWKIDQIELYYNL